MSRRPTDPNESQFLVILTIVTTVAIGLLVLAIAKKKTEPVTASTSSPPANLAYEPSAPAKPPPVRAPVNVLTTATDTYELPLASSSQDQRTLAALRRLCHDTARNNASGDYPAMQQQACYDYQMQAYRMGIEAKDVPPVRFAPRPTQPEVAAAPASAPDPLRGNCASLYAAKRQLQERMRQPNSPQMAEYLKERMRALDDKIYAMRCRDTGVD